MDGTRDGHFDGAWQGDGVVLSRFTLDLNKCIFCNLCCEPCPKECIHMGLEFDTAAYDRANGVKNLLTDAPWTASDRAARGGGPEADRRRRGRGEAQEGRGGREEEGRSRRCRGKGAAPGPRRPCPVRGRAAARTAGHQPCTSCFHDASGPA